MSMRVLLAFPPVPPGLAFQEMRSRPPLGVYTLAGSLRARGIDVSVADPLSLEGFLFGGSASSGGSGSPAGSAPSDGSGAPAGSGADEGQGLKGLLRDVDVLGVSCHSFNWGVGRGFVDRVGRLAPTVKIVLGGLHPTLFPEHALAVTAADYVIRGEGEQALADLVRALEAGDDPEAIVPGVVSRRLPADRARRPERLTLEGLAAVMPAYDLVPREYRAVVVESSRGCRHACAFCAVPYRGTWRGLPPRTVLDRLDRALAAAGEGSPDAPRLVSFVDDCFTADPDRALEILRGVAARDVRAIVEGRVDDVLAPGFLEAVPWEAVASLQLGVECGYDEGLRRIGKGITVAQVEQALDRIAALGAAESVVVSFIAGLPWESRDDWTRTIHFAAQAAYHYGVNVSTNVFAMFPSPLWQRRERYGIRAGPEVFDDPAWMQDEALFHRLHPNLDREAYGSMQSLLASYQLGGCPVVNVG